MFYPRRSSRFYICLGEAFLVNSDQFTESIGDTLRTRMYFDSPRVIAVSNSLVDFDPATQDGRFRVEVDVLRNKPRAMRRLCKLKSPRPSPDQ